MKFIVSILENKKKLKQQSTFETTTIMIISLLLVTLLINSPQLQAREEQYYPPALGPVIGHKAGVNAFPNPLGRKNGIAVNNIPDFGASLYVPLDFVYNIGMYVDLTFNTNTFLMRYNFNAAQEDYFDNDRMQFSYLCLSPVFNHAGFMIGFNFGIPVAANWKGINIATSKLKNIIEIKFGYNYPVYFDDVGRLNLFANISYSLNGIFTDFSKDDPLKHAVPAISPQIITNYYNPRPAGIQIGVNFLFNLIDLPEEYYE